MLFREEAEDNDPHSTLSVLEIEQIMEIVKQSYDAQAEGGIDCGLAINIL